MLVISNCTNQRLAFGFRTAEKMPNGELAGPFVIDIPSGQQRQVPRSDTPENVKAIVAQLQSQVGAHARSEIHGDIANFSGVLYSDDRPASEDEIHEGYAQSVTARSDRSVKNAVRGALGFDRSTRHGKRSGSKVPPPVSTSFEIEQEIPHNQKPTGNEVHMSLEVSPDGREDVALPV